MDNYPDNREDKVDNPNAENRWITVEKTGSQAENIGEERGEGSGEGTENKYKSAEKSGEHSRTAQDTIWLIVACKFKNLPILRH